MTSPIRRRKPSSCPQCHAKGTVRRIVYGEPAIRNEEQARRWNKMYVSGGCCCWGDERDQWWACVECGHWWGATATIDRRHT